MSSTPFGKKREEMFWLEMFGQISIQYDIDIFEEKKERRETLPYVIQIDTRKHFAIRQKPIFFA